MAEKYGTIPKKFTKKWWEYFWMYYKWYAILTVLVVVSLWSIIHHVVTAEKYDLTLTYAGKVPFSDEVVQKIENTLSPLCEDIDENGEISTRFSHLNIDFDTMDSQYLMAMITRLSVAFVEDETYLFILNKENADRYKGESSDRSAFAPLSDWLTADISGMNTYSAHGKEYGVDISNLKIFKDLGIDMSDHYLFMKSYPRKNQEKKHLKGYNGAIDLANKMLAE